MNEAQAIKRAEAALICADGVPLVTVPSEVILALLSANREMLEALAAIEATDTEFHETGRDQWGYAELEECMSADEVRALARSALTTQRGDGE